MGRTYRPRRPVARAVGLIREHSYPDNSGLTTVHLAERPLHRGLTGAGKSPGRAGRTTADPRPGRLGRQLTSRGALPHPLTLEGPTAPTPTRPVSYPAEVTAHTPVPSVIVTPAFGHAAQPREQDDREGHDRVDHLPG